MRIKSETLQIRAGTHLEGYEISLEEGGIGSRQ